MKNYKVELHTERHVAERGDPDIQCIILRRAGGPSDSVIPRYYCGLGKTRAWALQQAFKACREHGDFEPMLVRAPKRQHAGSAAQR